MDKNIDYDSIIDMQAGHVFDLLAQRCSREDVERTKQAFEFAKDAHKSQKRKTGEPYILHPIAVATIAAGELMLEANVVIAAFLHDVVEDTRFTLQDIENRFGPDVAGLVDVVTKRKKEEYVESKQIDNYRQILDSLQNDIRPLLVKICDRLHNMRTLSSMPDNKQMKIAGETDYFYAPLANRLGLYNVKTELENLSFRFRCPHEYAEIESLIKQDEDAQRKRLTVFVEEIQSTLEDAGIPPVDVRVEYRKPYSIWRKMHKYGDDFNHLKYRHFTEIVFRTPEGESEKDTALRIYSVLTDRFREKPGGISNYIDSPKENGYQSYHVKLLADFGRWQEVHISSERMVINSHLGCVADRTEDSIHCWIEKFRGVLRDIERQSEGKGFIDKVVSSFYNDDIMTFTPKGRSVVLPQKSTVLDFAYELGRPLGEKAKYARINGFLASVKAPLRRGDVVEIFTDAEAHPNPDWLDSVVTYNAQRGISDYLAKLPVARWHRCPDCTPMPGEEVIGFREKDGFVTLHKRDCQHAIRLASQQGDSIVSVDFTPDETLYPVTIEIKAVDRWHLFVDLVDCISNRLRLAIDSINTETIDNIVTLKISFTVHGFEELQTIMRHIGDIPGVDSVKRL